MSDLAAFLHSDCLPEARIRDPDRAFFIETDAIREVLAEIGPQTPIREAAIRRDVPCGEAIAPCLTHHERLAVRCNDAAVRKQQPAIRKVHRAVRVDAHQIRGLLLGFVVMVVTEIADIGLAISAHHHVVAMPRRDGGHVRVLGEGAVGEAHQFAVLH